MFLISSKCVGFQTFRLIFIYFFTSVCLKFNIQESRQEDLKVYDQSDTEVDIDVFEEIVKQSPGIFKVTLSRCLLSLSMISGHTRTGKISLFAKLLKYPM